MVMVEENESERQIRFILMRLYIERVRRLEKNNTTFDGLNFKFGSRVLSESRAARRTVSFLSSILKKIGRRLDFFKNRKV
jgi:hypothetical protein